MVRRLLAFGWPQRGRLALILLAQLLLLGVTLTGVSLLGLGVDILAHALPGEHPAAHWPLGWRPPAGWGVATQAVAVACVILALALLRFLLERWLMVARGQFVAELLATLRIRVYDRMQHLSFRFFDAEASGSIIQRVTQDVHQVRMFLDGVLLEALTLGLTLGLFLAWMLRLDWQLTLASLAPLAIMLPLTWRFSKAVKPAYKRNSELLDDAIRVLAENAQGVHVVKGFGLQQAETAKFRSASDAVQAQAGWLTRQVALFSPTAELVSSLPLVILLVYGGWKYSHGSIVHLGAVLVVMFSLLRRFSGQVGAIAQIAGSMQQAMNGARRVFRVLDQPDTLVPGAHRPEAVRGEVAFEAVDFAHAGARKVLHGITLAVPAGGRIAILGPTGSGKSTLLSLLPRFHDPVAGRITLDGRDLRDYDLASLRREVGVVFQETFLFSTTVAANIAFGRPDATRADIEAAARLARADAFVRELPQGYDTVLTEGGNGLSGGQRQRLALARALLTNPRILLLDDPTAAIDPATEREIMEALESAMQDRTVFIVAHRLQTLRRADRVVVLEDGRISAIGTHAELMQSSPHYREVVFAQTGMPALA